MGIFHNALLVVGPRPLFTLDRTLRGCEYWALAAVSAAVDRPAMIWMCLKFTAEAHIDGVGD